MSSAKSNILGRLRSAATLAKPYEALPYQPWQSEDAIHACSGLPTA